MILYEIVKRRIKMRPDNCGGGTSNCKTKRVEIEVFYKGTLIDQIPYSYSIRETVQGLHSNVIIAGLGFILFSF